jgi:molybdopterin synthase sulfur carrier subunit
VTVRVLVFAGLRERMGRAEICLELPREVGFDEFVSELRHACAPIDLAPLLAENVRVARNQTLIEGSVRIAPGDEIAFLPPVTGG